VLVLAVLAVLALVAGVAVATVTGSRGLATAPAGPAAAEPRAAAADGAGEPVVLTLFHGETCPHCQAERAWLEELQSREPALVVEEYEVYFDEENRALLEETAAEMGFTVSGVPITIVGDEVFVGFSEATQDAIELAVLAAIDGTAPAGPPTGETLTLPLIGEVDVASTSLLVSTLVIGFVDGVNPCSLWVLSVLLAIVLHSGSRGRVLTVGGVFLFVTAGMYALYVTGLYSALDTIGQLGWIRLAVAAVAIVFGAIHLKDFFAFQQGVSLSIPDSRKPRIYQRMRAVSAADASLPAVIAGTVVLAIGVSLLETPCTAGLPLLWTNLLAQQGVEPAQAAWLFAAYMTVFLLDELIVFALAVFTLRAAKVQEHHGRLLKLVSGSVMVTLAVTMLLVPTALESVAGTLVVFGVSALLVVALRAVERARHRAPVA
jgi:cytochrome c biogenesis protein CcdA/glutaredoxin